MAYHVKFTPDEKMPEGEDWVMCHVDDTTTLYVRLSTFTWPPEQFALLMEAMWAGSDQMLEDTGDCPGLTSNCV